MARHFQTIRPLLRVPCGVRSFMVRLARESDVPQVVSLLAEVQATYVGATPQITPEAILYHISGDWSQRKEAEFREQIDSGQAYVWVAYLGSTVVGYCKARLDGQGGGLGVHPEYQGGFVGPRLLCEAGKKIGTEKDIYLTTVPGTSAVAFYARLGFLPTGRNISHDFPRLRGGEVLPQVELFLSREKAKDSLERLSRLLSRQDSCGRVYN